jgi:hypothetical protein
MGTDVAFRVYDGGHGVYWFSPCSAWGDDFTGFLLAAFAR